MSKPEDDPAIRRVLREAGQAGDRARFEVNRNPLFALGTIGRYRIDEDLPLWVRQWLLDVAMKMLRASLYWPARDGQPEYNPTFKEATDAVVDAFGLTRQGWNAVEEQYQFLNDDMLAWCREELESPDEDARQSRRRSASTGPHAGQPGQGEVASYTLTSGGG